MIISIKHSGKDVASLWSHTINAEFTVVGVDYVIAVRSAELRRNHSMPMAVSIIAATAQMHECIFISDDSYFKGIPNLKTNGIVNAGCPVLQAPAIFGNNHGR